MTDWDDYRILLAVSRTGTFLAAGRALGVATSTIGRRISAWEARLETPLVRRGVDGVRLTDDGRAAARLAEQIEARIRDEERSRRQDDAHAAPVRVTAGEGFTRILLEATIEYRRSHPDVRIELLVDVRSLDLAAGEADIALRTVRPRGDGLVARRLGSIEFGLFAAPSYIARAGAPRRTSELADHDFVGFAGALARMSEATWLRSLGVRDVVVAVSSVEALTGAVSAGLGIGALATPIAASLELVRVMPALAPDPMPLWLVLHKDSRRSRRIVELGRFLGEYVASRT